jgi:hypothetical protein
MPKKKHPALGLTKAEISAMFASGIWAEKFAPFLDLEKAAALLIVPEATIYDWSSRGLLKGCARGVGKHLRIVRDRLIQRIFNEDFNS